MPAPTDTIRYVRINVSGELDGVTPIPEQPRPLSRGADGVIIIDVTNLGLIDPEFLAGLSQNDWALRRFRVVLAGPGGPGGAVDVIDAGGNVQWQAVDLDGVTIGTFNGVRGIMPASQIRIDDAVGGAGHTVWLDLFEIESTSDAIAATS